MEGTAACLIVWRDEQWWAYFVVILPLGHSTRAFDIDAI